METQVKTGFRQCPDCGETMEPQALVSSRHHFSRWWRCSNAKCQAEWLLPMFSGESEAVDQAWAV
jgi:ssDNA-binding Zn-finger/Zn-ribbon topoisomerase 1